MHQLLRQLRYNSPISITSTKDQGHHMHVGLRYENIRAALLVRKRTHLRPGDVTLLHPGNPAQITGASTDEHVDNIVRWFQNHNDVSR